MGERFVRQDDLPEQPGEEIIAVAHGPPSTLAAADPARQRLRRLYKQHNHWQFRGRGGPFGLQAFPQGSVLPGATPARAWNEKRNGEGSGVPNGVRQTGGRSRHDPPLLARAGSSSDSARNHRRENETRPRRPGTERRKAMERRGVRLRSIVVRPLVRHGHGHEVSERHRVPFSRTALVVLERADDLRGRGRCLVLPIIQGELWFGGGVGVYRKGHLPDRTTIGKIDRSLAFSSD